MSIGSEDYRQLSIPERLALVGAIWDSIAADAKTPLLSESQRQELERRAVEDDANPDDVIPWEQVKAAALGRLKP